MKNLIRRINRSPLRCGFFTLAIALTWFALSPPLKAVDCPSDCDNSIGQTALGFNALAVNTGFNNTGVGQGALQSNTSGGFNVAVGVLALGKNHTGQQNMAIGQEALANNIIGNFNMGIGFRALFMNTGSRNSAVGAAALRDNAGASDNTAIGSTAMRENTTGQENTATGSGALSRNTDGDFNMASGANALEVNTHGERNTATGNSAMFSNTVGNRNTASGNAALGENEAGDDNTAIGAAALFESHGNDNTAVGADALFGSGLTGSGNTAVGRHAGVNFTGTDHDNICIGAETVGVAGQSDTIRIGTNLPSGGMNISGIGFTIGSGFPGGGIQYLQFFGSSISIASGFPTTNGSSSCFVGGIFNQTPTAGSHSVLVGSNGKLADATLSSRRFKKDIAPIDKMSEGILALRPVTFHWKNDNTNEPEFGLVAEDVAEVNLDWITRNPQGEISGVRYETIPILLLNEFLKEHKKVEDLNSTVALQQKEMQVLTAQLKEQAAQIQKVSAQLEASKPAPKVVTNK